MYVTGWTRGNVTVSIVPEGLLKQTATDVSLGR